MKKALQSGMSDQCLHSATGDQFCGNPYDKPYCSLHHYITSYTIRLLLLIFPCLFVIQHMFYQVSISYGSAYPLKTILASFVRQANQPPRTTRSYIFPISAPVSNSSLIWNIAHFTTCQCQNINACSSQKANFPLV